MIQKNLKKKSNKRKKNRRNNFSTLIRVQRLVIVWILGLENGQVLSKKFKVNKVDQRKIKQYADTFDVWNEIILLMEDEK